MNVKVIFLVDKQKGKIMTGLDASEWNLAGWNFCVLELYVSNRKSTSLNKYHSLQDIESVQR